MTLLPSRRQTVSALAPVAHAIVTLGGVRVSEKGFGEAGRPRVKPSHEGVDE